MRLCRTTMQEVAKISGGTAGGEGSEHRFLAQRPDPVGRALRVSVQDQAVGRAELAGGDHIEIRQNFERVVAGTRGSS